MSNNLNKAETVLVVEDDASSRIFLEIALRKCGYEVVAADGVADARGRMEEAGVENLCCAITDYQMPEASGLQLLAWIRERDPNLATILVTGEGDKRIITESLRGGAVDFLEKPVELARLLEAVRAAGSETARRRKLAESEWAVREVGKAQERMLEAKDAGNRHRVEVCFQPVHAAGGDFFYRRRLSAGRELFILTDVSGHDLQAAFVSAYFQGVVHGMLARDGGTEAILIEFNRLLQEQGEESVLPAGDGRGIGMSLAACAVEIDFVEQSAVVHTAGTPGPVFVGGGGSARKLGGEGGSPLGWFAQDGIVKETVSTKEGGCFYLWTDGLELLAEKAGVSALSLAVELQRSRKQGEKPSWMNGATDDVLAAVIQLPPLGEAGKTLPVICERYRGDQKGEIDGWQTSWHRSLMAVAPGLPEEKTVEILMASREALLNGLAHENGRKQEMAVDFQITFNPEQGLVRTELSARGSGNEWEHLHGGRAGSPPAEKQRGLKLMEALANRVRYEEKGARVIMDFVLS